LKTVLDQNDILQRVVVAIDGPAGSGKSTTARLVAESLGFRHIDTGAMYRAVAYRVIRDGLDPEDETVCRGLADSLPIRFEESPEGGQRVFADDEDVTRQIRTPEVTRAVSPVSAHVSVRTALVRQQRILARSGGAVLEGRDIGTVVLTGAEVKIYLVASTRVRAERRTKEMAGQGIEATVDEVEKDIIRRDAYDSGREVSPLRKAVGAIEVDTSDLTIDGQVEKIVGITRDTAGQLAALKPSPHRNHYRKLTRRMTFAAHLISFIMKVVFGQQVRRTLDVDYDENYIFACNHISYADPPTVGPTLPRESYYLAKSALFKNPLFGRLIRFFNAIPLRRGVFDRDAMRLTRELLENGKSLLIFPEGSRSDGYQLGKPKSGVGYLAVNSGVAVLPVYVSGTNRLFRCFFRRERLIILQGAPIRLGRDSVADPDNKDRYREYSEMVMEAIQALKDDLTHGP
jgi:cytidylate kinase